MFCPYSQCFVFGVVIVFWRDFVKSWERVNSWIMNRSPSLCSIIFGAGFDLCVRGKPAASPSAAQALASVKTYTWRKQQQRFKNASPDSPRRISTRSHPTERESALSTLWGLNLGLPYAHCDVLSSYVTITLLLWHFSVIASLWGATLFTCWSRFHTLTWFFFI